MIVLKRCGLTLKLFHLFFINLACQNGLQTIYCSSKVQPIDIIYSRLKFTQSFNDVSLLFGGDLS